MTLHRREIGRELMKAPRADGRRARLLGLVMPWATSAAVHAGIFLTLIFAATIVQLKQGPPAAPFEVVTPDADFSPEPPGESLKIGPAGSEGPGGRLASAGLTRPLPTGEHRLWAPADGKDEGVAGGWGLGAGAAPLDAYGFGGGGVSGMGDFGMSRGGGTGKATFYGAGGGGSGGGGGGAGNAYYVIFVIDHSGSMVANFDQIRCELKDSIFHLNDKQCFHVIFFSQDTFQENTPGRLVKATAHTKRQAVAFLNDVQASGWGSSPIPALIAAFRAFKNAPDNRGRVMYILTDGEFDTSGYQYNRRDGAQLFGNDAVLAYLRENNRDKSVHVYPIILGDQPTARAEETMRTIAKENGGQYKYVAGE